jgi:predicted SprT family Zn-dependent metalloprotease
MEINLNPKYLDRQYVEWHSTLVHEMCHLWQEDYGHPSSGRYHNKEWSLKMEEIGLISSTTGKSGGKKIGNRMDHYIDRDGDFIKSFNSIPEEDLDKLKIKYIAYDLGTTIIKVKKRKKENIEHKYMCPNCKIVVWSKEEGVKILCSKCMKEFFGINERNLKGVCGYVWSDFR